MSELENPRSRSGAWRPGRGPDTDREYTAEEREFLVAIDRYKREHQRPFPTWREVLAVFKSLGYRKCASTAGPRGTGA